MRASRSRRPVPGDPTATSAAWYDDLRLAPVVAAGLRTAGLDEGDALAAAETTRILLVLPRPSAIPGRGARRDRSLIAAWLAHDLLRAALGVDVSDGVERLDGDRFAILVRWAVRIDAIERRTAPNHRLADRLIASAKAADHRLDRLLGVPAPGQGIAGP